MSQRNTAIICGLVCGLFGSLPVYAGMTTDAHGNVGYDTIEECDAAVQSGNARFYQSFTNKPPLRRAGEVKVGTARLGDLGPNYQLGACDMGVGRSHNRDGVARALQGKYVPYSPDTAVNIYLNKDGQPVRITMKQCDNHFSGPVPRPVPMPASPPPQVVVPPPVPAPESSGMTPYVFGTLGALHDRVSYDSPVTDGHNVHDSDTVFAGQVGAGMQFTDWVGAELFYQGADKLKFNNNDGDSVSSRNNTYGARLTVGNEIAQGLRLFGKLGVAGVRHSASGDWDDDVGGKTKAMPTAGLGLTFGLTDNLKLRADYDHYFRTSNSNPKWKDSDYLGLVLQYDFF